jgi:exopolyphosphatase/guanosine-5'-triphosphate,3'-diphosphate pyrophosphatase
VAKPTYDYRGRVPKFRPVGVVDIGSNSVRLVIYDSQRRAAAPVFNEKVLCGLGRGLAATGELSPSCVERALAALARFRMLCRTIDTNRIYAVATAAAREATNGKEFVKAAETALGHRIQVLSGKQEARLAAFGVIGSFPDADGVVGDLGGGSLELIDVCNGEQTNGVTLPLGPLRLIDESGGSMAKAREIVDRHLSDLEVLNALQGRSFYAVGGTWRNLGRLHMHQTGYTLQVINGYEMDAASTATLTALVSRQTPASLQGSAAISRNRAETLPYGAMLLERLLAIGKPQEVVISAWGVREGLLFSKFTRKKRQRDPLMAACWDFALRHSRSPSHEIELCEWTDQIFAASSMKEDTATQRLRHAACMLADIGWRTPPDYRGDRSYNIISQATFVGVDHPGRVFLALTVYFRYAGVNAKAGEELVAVLHDGMLDKARQLAATLRLAYVLSAAMPGMLPQIKLSISRARTLTLRLPKRLKDLRGEAVDKRLEQMADLLGCKPRIIVNR